MPSIFSKFRKDKDGSAAATKQKKLGQQTGFGEPLPRQPSWTDAWTRKSIEPEEVQELLRGCTHEMKSRALDLPFMILPFRPNSDSNSAKSFIRNYFGPDSNRGIQLRGEALLQELRLTEPNVLCSVVKWCWSRIPGGVVTWEAYELFKIGEQDSDMARDSFETFMPISVESEARREIIEDFFDLLASIAARGKRNGLGGRKLSRLAGWWAFEHKDTGNGFDGGYKSWASAADATSHLFFAYLRSKAPGAFSGVNGISTLPISLQSLVQATEYPPETPSLMQSSTCKIVMIVDSVSPTPFALLRRAKHFEYRDDDPSLQIFASYQDPVQTLTEECRRVLESISSINQSSSAITTAPKRQPDESWSRFEDLGFSGMADEAEQVEEKAAKRRQGREGLSSTPQSRTQDMGRPTTPSWADFLSSGFADEPGNTGPAPLLLPPDKVLPPIDTDRVRSSQSHRRIDEETNLEPGELASIAKLDLDDSFWWVWITSLAGEEPAERKAVFGRCALIETSIQGARWLVIEEKVKGAAPVIEEGAYLVEKKSRFGLSKKSRLTRRKSAGKKLAVPDRNEPYRNVGSMPVSKTSIGPDQHARIQAAAAALQQRQRQQENNDAASTKRSRLGEGVSTKTNSVMTLQPLILNEASPAMKWANKYDKDAIREAYLGNTTLGKGASSEALTNGSVPLEQTANGKAPATHVSNDRDLPAPPANDDEVSPVDNFEKPKIVEPVAAPPADAHPALEKQRTTERSPSPPTSPLARKLVPSPPRGPQSPPRQTDLEREADAAALLSQTSSPPKSPQSKKLLKKKNGGGGFKKLFGKKKSDKPAEPSAPSPVFDSGLSGQPQVSTLTRKFSKLGKKGSDSEKSSLVASSEPDRSLAVSSSSARKQSPARPSHIPIEIPSSPEPAVEPQRQVVNRSPEPVVSSVPTPPKAPAAASAFAQGPLEDPSSLYPTNGDVSGPPTPILPSKKELPVTEEVKDVPAEVTKVHEPSAEEKAAAEREAAQQQQDRWAQIRKAAAARAAAKDTEDTARPGQTTRPAEGESGDQETIESRVAKIKARVAELTGNMEAPSGKPEANRA